MRVTIASRIFLPETSAASFRLDALARELRDRGHDVTIVTATTPARMGEYAAEGIRVRRAPVLRNRDGYVRGYLSYLSFDVPLFVRLLFARRPDVVIAEPPPTTGFVVRVVAALRRFRYVYYAADIWSDAANSIDVASISVRILRRVEAGVFRRAAGVLAVNDEVAARVRELAPAAPAPVVVGNGVDTDIFRRDEGTAGGYAVYAGTMSEWQGVDVFIRALPLVREKHPEARALFLGQGTARDELIALADALGVADLVEFVDPVPAADAARRLRDADLSLVSLRPGQGYDYALPTKVMASLACGTPVLFVGAEASPVRDLLSRAPADAPAGLAVGDDPVAVAGAWCASLDARPSEQARSHLASWAEGEVSLAAVARRGAAVVERVAAVRQRGSAVS